VGGRLGYFRIELDSELWGSVKLYRKKKRKKGKEEQQQQQR